MDTGHLVLLTLAVGLVAFLYSSVGHAGASGYIAAMTLAGLSPQFIKPVALMLNILVAVIGTTQFYRAGHFSWSLFWPFALLSIPAAFLGGYWHLSTGLFRMLVGAVLLFSAVRLFWRPGEPQQIRPPPLPVAVSTGAGIGFLSGLTGTGGGIFLSPLMLLRGWAKTKSVAATSVAFILVNSVAGLLGYISSQQALPAFAWGLGLAAVIGGALGSHLGSRRFPATTIQALLGSVLVIAGVKLLAFW